MKIKSRALAWLFLFCFAATSLSARTIIGVTTTNQLVQFDHATPGTLSAPVAIAGLTPGDVIHGIDFRPATGILYAVATNGTSGRIYTINTATAFATLVGAAPFSTTLIASATYGIDFDPTSDVIRLTNSADANLRVNPNDGMLVGADTILDPGSNESIVGTAYDRNDKNPATATTLFGINFITDQLVRIGGVNGSPSPNGGVITVIGSTGIVTASSNIGFDIAEDGLAYASMAVSGPSYRFYSMNLTTGAATLIGNIGAGTTAIRGIAAVPSPVANITSGEFFTTIQAAINDAQTQNGHTITVNAGTFSEFVTVSKSVALLGARSGLDARSAFRGTQETVVKGAAGKSAFYITAESVVIDGFTVQDATDANQFGAGIFMAPNLAGAQIRNNVIQNNICGLIVSNDTASKPLVIEHNRFLNNNQPGPISGTAIYTDQFDAGTTFTSAVIDDNTFENNQNVAVFLGSTLASSQSNVAISRNVMSGNGNGIVVYNLLNSFITGNVITASLGSQVALGGGINDLSISENTINSGSSWGIRIGVFAGGGGTNQNVLLGSNQIVNNATGGLEIDATAGAYTGTLIAPNNWWGAANGPTIASNPAGMGQPLIDPSSQTVFTPFLVSNFDYQSSEPGFQCFPAPVFYGIRTATNSLVRFSADNLGTLNVVGISGLAVGENIIGIDFRPATGQLYGLSSASRLYVIDPASGAATQVGASGGFTLDPAGYSYGFDFNPVADRIRVTSDASQNIRVNPNNGALSGTDTALAYAAGDPLFGAARNVGGSAHLNNYNGTPRTTLYGIDTFQNVLVRQGSFSGTPTSPNTGSLFTVGPLGIDPTNDNTREMGFDIFSPVPGVNVAYAILTTNALTNSLTRINLVSGTATTVGSIGAGNLTRALAIAPVGDFSFSAPSYSIGEAGPVATITINRLHGSEGSVTVDFTTSNGTANGSDYTNADQTVTFGSGVTSQTVQVPITNDPEDENFTETILLGLRNPTNGAFLGTQATATLTIIDDDVLTPTLATQQSSAAVGLGEPIFNVATISGGVNPGGTVKFELFGPNNGSCSGAAIFTSIIPVNGNGNYASASFMASTPGVYNWVVTYSGDSDHTGGATSSCGAANQSFAATDTGLGNIATRLRVETGDNVLIAGFIVTGTQPKKIIVRGIGSSLQLADRLADPTLELRDSTGTLLEADDDWKDSFHKQEIIDSTIPPTDDRESAIVFALPANASSYTAILRGANNTSGIGVVEAYDLNRLADSELANISTRGFVSTGDNVLIAGTIVVGKASQKVIVRAIGPSLGLPNKMEDPTLELRDGNGGLIEANDNWMDSPNKQAIIDSTIPPTNDLESAIVATLPGNNASYTAILRGANGTTGIAVVELYALP
jgi:hypothetical protein